MTFHCLFDQIAAPKWPAVSLGGLCPSLALSSALSFQSSGSADLKDMFFLILVPVYLLLPLPKFLLVNSYFSGVGLG